MDEFDTRGADLMDSTPRQIALFETLNFAVPDFWHVPLFRDDDGQRMAKRDNAHSLEAWISQGRTAPDLVGLFAFQLGLVETQEPLSAQQLANGLSLDRFTRALGARLDSDSGG